MIYWNLHLKYRDVKYKECKGYMTWNTFPEFQDGFNDSACWQWTNLGTANDADETYFIYSLNDVADDIVRLTTKLYWTIFMNHLMQTILNSKAKHNFALLTRLIWNWF